jgi:hypothetical protein
MNLPALSSYKEKTVLVLFKRTAHAGYYCNADWLANEALGVSTLYPSGFQSGARDVPRGAGRK